jgi:uncharacterized protein (TIGR02001 family)
MTALAAGPPPLLRWPAHKVARGRNAALGWAVGLAPILLGLPAPATAQVGVSVGIATDARLRGLSLTNMRPALTLNLSYDHASGVYAGGGLLFRGGFLGGDADADDRFVGHNEYLGFTAPLGPGRSWDIGVSNQAYTLDYERRLTLHYTEAYLGLVQGDVSAHVYFAPDYPRHGVNSAYADLNASHRFAGVWRLTGHVGAHERLGGTPERDGRRWRYDTQLGVAREFTKAELNLAWTASAPDPLPHPAQSRPGVVLGAKYFF